MLELLLNGEIYAPEPMGRRNILIAGGRVAWIGEAPLEIPAALDAEVVDLAGHRVIPGLIDCHVHITGGGGEGGFDKRLPPIPWEEYVLGGTTTVVGLLGTDDTTRGTADLVATARSLTAKGMTAYCLTGGYHLPPATLTGTIRGDLIHIDRIIGLGEIALSDHRSSHPSLEEFVRAASDAYVGGMIGGKAGHTHVHLGDGTDGLKMVREALERSELPARVFHPTHVNRRAQLFEEALELAAQGSTIDVTTIPVEADEDGLTAEMSVRRYFESNVPADRITVSSDAGGSIPVFDGEGRLVRMDVQSPRVLGETLARLAHSSLPIEKVLPAFTLNVARVLQLPGKGRLATGTDADLVVLDEADRVTHVMVGGQWVVEEGRAIETSERRRAPAL